MTLATGHPSYEDRAANINAGRQARAIPILYINTFTTDKVEP
jgi:hypothetical protein